MNPISAASSLALAIAALLSPALSAGAAPDGGAPAGDSRPAGAPPETADAGRAAAPGDAPTLRVVFRINDSMVKDKLLPDTRIGVARSADGDYEVLGTTDASGRFETSLAPGTYFVTYRKESYVPIDRSRVEIDADGQVITTTLSMLLEAGGQAGRRRIQIVLNWGSDPSQVKDADSHLLCACGKPGAHVSYVKKTHEIGEHSAALDVDDTDWGGPETITLLDPPPGKHVYWVHDYSGPPAVLGASDVVVRVLFGDRVAGEFRVPEGLDSREWRPFESLEVDPMLDPKIVPFTAEQFAAGEDRREPSLPPDSDDEAYATETAHADGSSCMSCEACVAIALLVLLIGLFVVLGRLSSKS
ncbi:MAG: hypothetical protein JXR96_07940 [Deltaproteobacteria bacterium]|nr:hypothetical protein [Deltaproteobacteria bacterium]